MPWKFVRPHIAYAVRGICAKPYPLHPKGCPNYGVKPGCPPTAPMLEEAIDVFGPVYAIWNKFPLGEHVRKMRMKFPNWSERQLNCCLYWQPTARKQLAKEITEFESLMSPDMIIIKCPEAMGLEVTSTMAGVGVKLEWPPKEWVYQVALAGHKKSGAV